MDNANMDNEPVRFSAGINIMLALWLVLSPFLLGYAGTTLALWNALIVGLVMFVLASFRMLRPAGSGIASLVNLLLGAWLAVSPFVLGLRSTYAVMWNNFTVGLAVVFFAIVGLLLTGPASKSRE